MITLCLQKYIDDQKHHISLPQGEFDIGAAEDCAIQLESDSLFPYHCRLIVEADRVVASVLEDGAFMSVNDEETSVKQISPGDTLTLGDITFIVLSPVEEKPRIKVALPRGGAGQNDHSKFLCSVCGIASALDECRSHTVGYETQIFCPQCGGRCYEQESAGSIEQTSNGRKLKSNMGDEKLPDSFSSWLKSSFGYPLHLEGIVILSTGVLLYSMIKIGIFISSFAGLLGLMAVVLLSLLGGGYYLEFLKSIIIHASKGEDKMDWPTFEGISETAAPFIGTLFLGLLCFIPYICWNIFVPGDSGTFKIVGGYISLIAGCLVFPMAFLGYTLFETFAVINPAFLFPSILRVKGAYFAICSILVMGIVIQRLVEFSVGKLTHPILAGFLGMFVSSYLYVIVVRALGYLYFYKKGDLRWDS